MKTVELVWEYNLPSLDIISLNHLGISDEAANDITEYIYRSVETEETNGLRDYEDRQREFDMEMHYAGFTVKITGILYETYRLSRGDRDTPREWELVSRHIDMCDFAAEDVDGEPIAVDFDIKAYNDSQLKQRKLA